MIAIKRPPGSHIKLTAQPPTDQAYEINLLCVCTASQFKLFLELNASITSFRNALFLDASTITL